jgi:DNA-directed RNA polymerase subunit M
MKFCEKCGSLFIRKGKKFECGCGNTVETLELSFSDESKTEKRSLEVAKDNEEIYATTPAQCPKCSHDRAYTWSRQMRGGDEPETIFFKCIKCSHSWRQSRG